MIVAGNVREVADKVSVGGAAPVPVSCTDWVPRSSTMVSAPVAGPATAGVNSTCNWQSVFAGKEVTPQAFAASTNGQETVMLVMATGVPPLFSAVTASGFDVVAALTWPKSIVVGVKFNTGGVSP